MKCLRIEIFFYIITIYLQEVDVIRQPNLMLSLKYCKTYV